VIAFVVPPSFVEALLDLVLRVDGRTRSESSSAAPEWNRYGSPLIPRTNRYLSVKGEHAGMSRSLRFLTVIIPKNGVIANGCDYADVMAVRRATDATCQPARAVSVAMNQTAVVVCCASLSTPMMSAPMA